MVFDPGTRVGLYEILAAIGAGGMGQVYRARDTRLKRDVALKFLPESFAADPDRLARFQREAEVLASLSHDTAFSPGQYRRYTFDPKSDRFAVGKRVEEEHRGTVVFLMNFFDELRHLAPVTQRSN